ncbi:CoxG family protein [Cupriavidus respiraculi]|uniref:4-hydroxybenzoyl-CoA reductase n=1 Tax=Cupriavidus respiraculi TaxID=195930 RepID=A0ABM8WNL2_9BURK|nr:SRPBCC family protein [Cupriavidus respiraculi]CAG9169012.1 hypothetical protein LMG21510_01314 [Cupriavidus respiraculi]
MEIEKTLTVAAPAAGIWQLLLDPNVMGACVPGMQSIEVISDVEYVSHIQVKIAFISARFRIKTHIVEMRAPHYLRSEGTGEDASVASSLKQESEIFLTELPDGRTELRAKVQVEVLGRLGTFGLSIMKTKADRMWDEFCQNLVARLENPDGARQCASAPPAPAAAPARSAAATEPTASAAPRAASGAAVASGPKRVAEAVADTAFDAATARGPAIAPSPAQPAPAPMPAADDATMAPQAPAAQPAAHGGGWLSRLLGRPAVATARGPLSDICIEVRRPGETITVRWPVQHAQACSAWLRDYLKP